MYRKDKRLKLVLCAGPKYINMAGSHITAFWKITLWQINFTTYGLSGPLTLFRQDESYTISGAVNVHLSSNNLLSVLNLVLEGRYQPHDSGGLPQILKNNERNYTS